MTNNFTFSGTIENTIQKSTKTGYQLLVIRLTQTNNWQGKHTSESIDVTLFGDMAHTWAWLKAGQKLMVSGKLSGKMNSYNGKEYFNMTLIGKEIALLSDTPPVDNSEDVPF